MNTFNEYLYCFVIKKSRCNTYNDQSWINPALLKIDFCTGDYHIFGSSHIIQKINAASSEFTGQIIGFKSKNDAIRFKIALPRYIKIKNHTSLYFEYNDDVQIKIKELTILQKEYNESRLNCSELQKVSRLFTQITNNRKISEKDFARDELIKIKDFSDSFCTTEISKVKEKITEIKQLVGVN